MLRGWPFSIKKERKIWSDIMASKTPQFPNPHSNRGKALIECFDSWKDAVKRRTACLISGNDFTRAASSDATLAPMARRRRLPQSLIIGITAKVTRTSRVNSWLSIVGGSNNWRIKVCRWKQFTPRYSHDAIVRLIHSVFWEDCPTGFGFDIPYCTLGLSHWRNLSK